MGGSDREGRRSRGLRWGGERKQIRATYPAGFDHHRLCQECGVVLGCGMAPLSIPMRKSVQSSLQSKALWCWVRKSRQAGWPGLASGVHGLTPVFLKATPAVAQESYHYQVPFLHTDGALSRRINI